MYYIYILFSDKDKQLYTGFTDNLQSRFKAHTEGYVKATKYRRPLKLIYYEAHESELDARRREKYLKGGNGRGELKIQLKDVLTNPDQQHPFPNHIHKNIASNHSIIHKQTLVFSSISLQTNQDTVFLLHPTATC